MTFLGNEKVEILKELYEFLKQNKKWWISPLFVFLILLGFAIYISNGSVVAPFVYTLF